MINGRVLTIAGSDSGGGAGIQADIKTITALGGYASSAITAVTDQDTKKVYSIHSVPPDFVAAQIKTVLSDIGADVIKIGMLHTLDMVRSVTAALESHAGGIPLIVDPVMVSTSGYKLMSIEAINTFKLGLIKLSEVLTPNLPEAEALTGLKIHSISDMQSAIPALRNLGAKNVLLKGGHLRGNSIADLLITEKNNYLYEGERILSNSTHGTGCTLASAIAISMAQGLTIVKAVSRARNYVNKAIITAPQYGSGCGPLNHTHPIP
jgi:hydroxymethylpyrimidine/phosphomethylpyrimidine kinase